MSKLVRCSRRCASSSLFAPRSLAHPLVQLGADEGHGPLDCGALRHEVCGRIDRRLVQPDNCFAGERVEAADALDVITEQLYADGLLFVGRVHLYRIAAHAERAAHELQIVAHVLHAHQGLQNLAPGNALAHFEHQHQLAVLARIAQAVDAGDRRHDDHVLALHQRGSGAQAQALDVFVDRRVFFDVRVRRRHVRFGLVVVVVRDEVLDGVAPERNLSARRTAARPGSCCGS